MKKEYISEIKGVIILAFGLLLLASLVSFVPEDLPWYTSHPNVPSSNLIRIVGAYTAGSLLFTFGYSTYFLVVFLLFWSWNKFSFRDIHFTLLKCGSFLILFLAIGSLFGMIGLETSAARFQRAGMAGFVCSDFLIQYIGRTGAYIILSALSLLTLILTGEFLVSPIFFWVAAKGQRILSASQAKLEEQRIRIARAASQPKPQYQPRPEIRKSLFQRKNKSERGSRGAGPFEGVRQSFAGKVEPKKPTIRITGKPEGSSPPINDGIPKLVGEYRIPSLDLLETPPSVSPGKVQSHLEQGAKILEATLSDFNVNARVADIERGPVITRYELEPAPGVKVQKITALSNDIALAMKVAMVRIVAPIPGKNRVGIEVPNSSTAAVYLKNVLSEGFGARAGRSIPKLMLALGKDISGKPLMADLAQMPHLLIAGTTGSGKTVCINSIIMSMLFNASPEEVKFLMVDPKMVELALYNDIPHMLCPAVTDHKKVSAALNWVVGEMESRYMMLSKAGVRNITAYHDKGHALPYIVVVIDELADLMQVSAKTIESAITRLAQLSRAVGIHLILATQRPSVNVITGVIKANFPARISFKVASKVDSRTVLDLNGAEALLGRGDFLFIKPGEAKPTRGQGSFVTDAEVYRVIDFIKNQQEPVYDNTILEHQKKGGVTGVGEKDELYDEALQLVIETNQASVSILQRRMRLGYTRAARLIDMMEQGGVVGPYCGSKPRDILIDREEWLTEHMRNDERR